MVNLTVRQCLLKIPDSSVAHLRVGEVERFKLGQCLEVGQPGVAHLRAAEVERSEVFESADRLGDHGESVLTALIA